MEAKQKLESVYLIAKIGTIHHQLLPFFFEYYIDEICILPENFIVTIHDNHSESLDVTLKHFNNYKIKPFHIWQGDFTPVGVMYHFMRMLTSVPENKWIVPVDIDEFNFKAKSLISLIEDCEKNNYDYVSSTVIDMVSSNGIIELNESISLWEQFPCQSRLTTYIGLGQPKLILMRPYVMPQTGGFHGPSYSLARYYKAHPEVQNTYHFKWYGDVLNTIKTYNNSVNEPIYQYLRNGHSLIVLRKPFLYYPKVLATLMETFWSLAKSSFRRMLNKD